MPNTTSTNLHQTHKRNNLYFLNKTLRPKSRFIFVLAFLLLLVTNVFGQTGATHIYTDYGGFWSSGQGAINPILPDNDHNLLAFRYKNIVYSTGVNNGILGANGISYSNTKFQAFPVKNIPLANGGSVFAAYGKLRDNLPNAIGPAPFTTPLQISTILTSGINGLNIGSGITNIPSTAEALTFNFGAITDPTQIGDGVPDIIVSQIAAAGGAVDQLYFEDGSGNRVGNIVSISMESSGVPALGNWTMDFYNPDGTTSTSQPCCNQTRPIRLWAADAADFGITQANYSSALVLRYKLNGSSDPAFLAFNTAFIQIVSVNDDIASTNENTPVNINVLANDEPATGLNPNSMTITQQPANGTVSINTINGVRIITYTPNPGFTGTDTFRYQVCNSATVPQCDDALVTVNVGSADVQIVKTANTLTPAVGGNVIFTLTARNNGPNTANNVVVRDVLPAGYEYVSTTGTYNSTTSNWAIGAMASNTTASTTITARVKETGPYANTATISTSTLDAVEANNTSTVTPVPVLSTDLQVTKTASSLTPNVGANVTFTITAKNNGPSNATGVVVNDLLPSGYTMQSFTAAGGTTYNATNGVWTIGSLTGGATTTPLVLTVIARVNAIGPYANTASISGAQTDPVANNNSITVTPVPVAQADLAVSKSVSPSVADVNTNVVFTIGVVNNGPSAAQNAVIRDQLPSGYEYVSHTASAGTYTSSNGEWTIGNLANAASATLTITAKVKPSGVYLNTATTQPISTTTADPVSSNNTASATPTVVPITDLKVTKTATKDILNNAGTVNPGDIETFIITVTNTGPSNATNIVATDQLPSGYTYSSHNATVGNYAPGTGLWTIPTLANGASATLTINATILSTGNYTNSVKIVGTEKDPDLSNNEAFAPSQNTAADVRISKNVNNASPYVGDLVTFTLTATNDASSSSDATQVTIVDQLPSGYEFNSFTSSVGTYNPVNGIWYIGNLIKGNSATLNIVARVKPNGDYLNTTSISATQSDPVPSNNNANVLTTPIASADLVVIKSLDNASLNNGNAVFTIRVTNNGASTATNVTINDALPSGYNYVSNSATAGSYAAGVWTVGNLVSGASATLTLTSTLNSTGNYVNIATGNSITRDPNTANNTSSAQPAPLAPNGPASQTFCEIEAATVARLIPSGANIKWYANATGGSALASTVALVNNTKYYATQTIAGAESTNRLEVTVTITQTAAPTTALATQTFCEIAAAKISDLAVTGTNIKWYTAATGGTVLPITTPLVNNTVYYASQTLNGCESRNRLAITALVTVTAAPTGSVLQNFCELTAATIASLQTNATGLVKWYETATSTVPLASTRALVDGETYYASQTLSGCESASRFAVKVSIAIVSPPAANATQRFCTSDDAKVSNLTASGSSIVWYATSAGGSPLAPNTSLVSGSTYYASQIVDGCESKNRTAVTVNINPNATAVVSGGGTVCEGATLPKVSIALTGVAPWNIIYSNGTTNTTVTNINASPYVINGAGAGNYTVVSLSDANCAGTSTGSATVTVNGLPTATVSGGGATCAGSPTSNVNINLTGTAPFNFTYTNGSTTVTETTNLSTFVIANAAVGNYSVTSISDASGCAGTASGSATVSVNAVPTATISGGGIFCYTDPRPNIIISLTGTAPWNFIYTVNGTPTTVTNHNSNVFTISAAADGIYAVTNLSDANCTGAGSSTTVKVLEINVPQVTVINPNCSDGSTGSILVTSPLDPTLQYSIDNGVTWQSDPYFPGLPPSPNYKVLARKDLCVGPKLDVTINPALGPPIILSTIQPNCNTPTGTITLGQNADLMYSIDGGTSYESNHIFSGLAPGTYQTRVKSSTGCLSDVLPVTINPQPSTPLAPTVTATIEYCIGATANVLTATADSGNTLHWYTQAVGGVASNTAPTPSKAAVGEEYFYVSQVNASGCESPRSQIKVTTVSLPPAPVSGGDQDVCASSPLQTLTATATTVAGSAIEWFSAPSGGNLVTNPILNTIGTVTYYASAKTSLGCESSSRTAVKLTINEIPNAPSGNNQTVCADPTVQTLTAMATVDAGNSVVWYDAPSGGDITNPTLNAVGSVTYYAVAKNDVTGCESATRTPITLTINETPSAPIANNQTECASSPLQTLTANATVPVGHEVVWYTLASGGTVVTNPTLNVSGTITYYAASKNTTTGCESIERTAVTLTLRLPLASGTIGSNQSLCRIGNGLVNPTALTFTTAPSGGNNTYTYVWQSSLDNFATVLATNLSANASYTPAPINVTTFYRVLITSGDCGTVTSNTVTITVQDVPTLVLAGNASQNLCSSNAISNIVYTWGGSATGVSVNNLAAGLTANVDNNAKTVTIMGIPTETKTYTITTTGNILSCATQASLTGTITVNDLPPAPVAGIPQIECAATPIQTLTAVATAPAGNTVVWYDAAVNGNIVATPTLNTVGVKNYYAASKNTATGCESTTRTLVTLKINELPSAPSSGGDQIQCATSTLQVLTATTAPVPNGYSVIWYSSPTGGTPITPSLNSVGSITYYAATKDNDTGCESLERTAVNLTITPRNIATAITAENKEICAGQKVILEASSSLSNPIYRWYSTADLSTAPIFVGENFETPNLSNTTKYYVTVQSLDACENLANTAKEVTVTVNPLPTAVISGNVTVCQNAGDQTITFTGAGGTAPYTFTYNIDGGTNQTVVSTSDVATLIQSSANAGTFVYNLISVEDATSTKCSNVQTGSVTVVVNPVPKGYDDAVTLDCAGILAYDLQANVNNTTNGGNNLASSFTWTVNSNANVMGANSGNGTSINQTLFNTSNTVQQLVYTITPTATGAGNCTGNSFTLTVTVPVCSSIAISKSADKASISKVGDVVNYTIVVENTGNASQNGVIVSDPMLSAVALSNPTGDNGNNILEKGETWTYTGSYTVLQSDIDNDGKPTVNSKIIRNTATVTSTEIASAQSANADVNITVSPEITLVKTGVLALDGNTITYTFLVKNTGNVTVNNLAISDAKINSPIVLGSGTLAPGATTTASANYIISQSEKEFGSVSNTATLSGKTLSGVDVSDVSGTAENNDNPTIVNTGVLAIDDKGSANGFTGGEAVANVLANDAYNGTPATLANVNLSQVSTTNTNVTLDPLTGKVNVEPNTPAGTYTVEYRIEDKLNPGQFKTASVTVTVDAPAIVAVADSGSANGFTGGEAVANVLVNDTYNGIPATLANVNLTQVSTTNTKVTLDPLTGKVNVAPNTPAGTYTVEYRIEDKLNPGQFKTASVTVTVNTGTITAVNDNGSANGFAGGIAVANILANDTYNGGMPASLVNVSINQLSTSNSNINIDVNTGAVNVLAGTLPGTYTLTYEIVDKLDASRKSTATISIVVPDWITDLSITKSANKSGVEQNENISYTITVKNNGPASILAGKTIGLVENIPVGLDNVTFTANGGTYNASNQSFMVAANVLAGQTVSLTVDGKINSAYAQNSIVNVATVNVATGASDPDVANNSASVTTPILKGKITLVKNGTVSLDGNSITYTFTIANVGDVPLDNITLVDAKLGLNKVVPGMLAVGASLNTTEVYILSQADKDLGSVTNTASVNSKSPAGNNVSDISGTDASNDTPTVISLNTTPKLQLTKVANNTVVKAGDVINYTLVVKNTGNVTLSNLVVTDAGADAGSITPATITSLLPGAMVTISAKHTLTQAELNAGRFSNQANVSGIDPKGNTINQLSDNPSTPELDDATVVYFTARANIVTVKQLKNSNQTSYIPGEEVVFLITMTNRGPSAAVDVNVVDNAPAETNITKWTATATGVVLPVASGVGNLNQTIALLPNGAEAVYEVTVKTSVTSKLPLSNTVRVSSATPDVFTDDDILTTKEIAPQIRNDLSITKLSNRNLVSGINDEFEYVITVKNNGLFTANNVVVTDLLPVGMIYNSHSTIAGNAIHQLANNTLVWTVPSLNAGESMVLILRVKSTQSGLVSNTVTVKAAEDDPATNNNSATDLKEIFVLNNKPNVITPNGDGKNDTYVIQGLELYPENNLQIFNRWGNEVYHSNGSYKNNWAGEGLNEGTYYYILKLKDRTGQWQALKGWITLLKDQ